LANWVKIPDFLIFGLPCLVPLGIIKILVGFARMPEDENALEGSGT
jgi:hypothetical protein